ARGSPRSPGPPDRPPARPPVAAPAGGRPAPGPQPPGPQPPAPPPTETLPPVTITLSTINPRVDQPVTLAVGTARAPSPVAAHWTFGDGQEADGLVAQHAW